MEEKRWFEKVRPQPTTDHAVTQISVHLEEMAETLTALGLRLAGEGLMQMALAYREAVGTAAAQRLVQDVDRLALLDALCDVRVTAAGVAHMLGMDIEGAMAEVNASNRSKFVAGQPLFDATGKVAKGPGYHPPRLEAYAGLPDGRTPAAGSRAHTPATPEVENALEGL